MAFELDHVFVWCDVGAPEAERLKACGLSEGPPNRHPGQGTACRRFRFRNAYLELLWIADRAEAEAVSSLPLRQRWEGRRVGTSPFGLIFRPGPGPEAEGSGRLPFSAFEYRPAYLPEPRCIQVARNAGMLSEPMLFYMAFARRPDCYPAAERPCVAHAVGWQEVTRITLIGPCVGPCSPELRGLHETGLLGRQDGPVQQLELGFDGEREGCRLELAPDLPLVFAW